MTVDTFEFFKKKYAEWDECFSGDDTSSVLQQLWALEKESSIYRVLLKVVELADKDKEGNPALNPMLFNAFRRWHANSKLMALRRLLDPYDRRDKKAVFSLRWLVSDMLANVAYLTRSNLLRIEGYESDPDELDKKRNEWLRKQEAEGSDYNWVPSELDDFAVRTRLIHIDKLSGVSSVNRKPDDKVSARLLESLVSQMKTHDCIKGYVDKFLAHAATPNSRQAIEEDVSGLVWKQIWAAEKTVCQVAMLVEGILYANRGSILVSTIWPIQFMHLEKPLVKPKYLKDLEEAWHEYSGEVSSWREWDWDSLV